MDLMDLNTLNRHGIYGFDGLKYPKKACDIWI